MNKIVDSYIVKYKNTNYRNFRKNKNFLKRNKIKDITEIWPELRLCHIKTEDNQGINITDNLRKRNDIEYIIQNEIIPLRKGTRDGLQPNDPNYIQQDQWCHQKMESEEAWKITTGGTTANGIEIVTGVVDGGFYDHEDLQNVFIEPYNTATDNHGTHVAGIIGANGNNGKGVVGVNWDIKIIPVGSTPSGPDVQTTYGLISQYYDIYKFRKQFNVSGGTQGHYVVSINSSWGFDGQSCTGAYNIYNEAYEIMGQEGILNCAATANASWDIDTVGDVPTGCASNYLISVTNSTNEDILSIAGYGSTTIDLAAPGTSILSTTDVAGYSSYSGTSMATPQVTGTIALMYSALSQDIIEESITNPTRVANDIKNLLLTSGVDTEGLSGNIIKTVTGGRLNLRKAVEAAQNLTYSITKTIILNEGWTLIGLPVDIEDSSLNIFPNSNAIFNYSNNGYTVPEYFEPLKGYWVRNDSIETVSIKGQSITPPDIWILNQNTWILISGLSYESIITTPSAEDYILYEYEGSYNITNKLEPGKGYWLKSTLNNESNLEINRLYYPTAISASYNIQTDSVLEIILEGNDANDLVLIYEITSLVNGTLTKINNNTYSYQQTNNNSFDSFTFKTNNGYYDSEESQVNIYIGSKTLKFNITTDNYPEETTWQLSSSTNNYLQSGGPYSQANTNYEEIFTNVPVGDYIFEIYDSYGDGICCSHGNGSYSLSVADDIIVASTGEFQMSELTEFSITPLNI
jgi:subtilisin family serine protease